ncbi:transcriptional regulator [Caulobacter vibrioides]|uniref:Transcriptional regulator n=1 Tax=Caulobacter vibrioides TaxID=155892 RepID=A0A290MLZ2_CAUVI|nr:MucR family transcriptional regulator [Caulobacter vibrioides]ATC33031.1 transcriptional regulator [Caulobacter vibrioides]
MADDKDALIKLTTGVVAAYVGNNRLAIADLPALVSSVFAALEGAGAPVAASAPAEGPVKLTAAQIRKSITHDALISFIDGKSYKTLKRHLSTHGLTVVDYRAKFGLPADYPTTAPSYSEARSAMAKALGLGQGGRKGKAAAKGRGKKA